MSDTIVYLLGLNTFFVGLGVAIYMVNTFKARGMNNVAVTNTSKEKTVNNSSEKKTEITGVSKGESELIGIDDDEVTSVILASVCDASKKPPGSLKIKSIKLLENS